MVNQFVFCPRFFHLAWSSGERGENELTTEGKWLHRRVDAGGGSLDMSVGVDKRVARSVELSSESLGVIAKIDMVEQSDGRVVPVEMKRTKPTGPFDGLWEPELLQLIVSCLLLQDNGFVCNESEVLYAIERQRQRYAVTQELRDRVAEVLSELRLVAADPVPPAPLLDSPKCPTCIMVGACLPDEHNLLRDRTTVPPRRLTPSFDAASPLYVTEPGAQVGVDGQRIVVRRQKEELASLRFLDVSSVSVFGNVQVTAHAMRELFSKEIPVCWFTGGGWFSGIAEGLPSRNVELRRRQVMADEALSLRVARRMVEGKILNARTLLRRNTKARHAEALNEMKRLASRAASADSFGSLLGLEGGAARIYFSQFSSMIVPIAKLAGFDFEKRSRRPPTDPVNAVLSYVYGLLVKDITVTCLQVGFDPYQGVFHQPRFGRPALALDLAEEFRPIVGDSVVLTVLNNNQLSERDVVRRGGAVALTADARKTVIGAYEARLASEVTHPMFGYRVSYRRAFEVQARLFGAVLVGEIDEYTPMVTR
jgi:CRISP-associated protein Cas1